jgi:cyclase
MRRIRVIPALLIQDGGLVKSVQFRDYKYVGDPINAVKIFNEKEVDELVILDISATAAKRPPDMAQIREIAGEAFMPMGYGGGVTTLEQIREIVTAGIEKIVINTAAFNDPNLVRRGADYVGSQSIVVSIDVRKNVWGKYKVYIKNGSVNSGKDPIEHAKDMSGLGAGEILLNSIDRDGTFKGYDTELIKAVSSAVGIPIVAIGGAAVLSDFASAIDAGASAVAAGSFFVFQGPHRAVLVSYPSQNDLREKLFLRHER